MKYLLIILLFVSFKVNGQFSATKTYSDSSGDYKIVYQLDMGMVWIPATMNGEPHHSATISVYKIVKNKEVLISEGIKGTYVADGCFEDEPVNWVRTALNIRESKKKKDK